jgi:hypothetical protein
MGDGVTSVGSELGQSWIVASRVNLRIFSRLAYGSGVHQALLGPRPDLPIFTSGGGIRETTDPVWN